MSLSRKRRKELRKLRGHAEDLWQDQQALMNRANKLARDAKRQAGHYAEEQVLPVVREKYEHYLQPGVDRGSRVLKSAGEKVGMVLVPAVGSVVGTALSVVDAANESRVKSAIKRGSLKELTKPKSKGVGFGGYLAIGAGVAALAGIGYAVWQTFRADDDLWVADADSFDTEISSPNPEV